MFEGLTQNHLGFTDRHNGPRNYGVRRHRFNHPKPDGSYRHGVSGTVMVHRECWVEIGSVAVETPATYRVVFRLFQFNRVAVGFYL